jgi:WD40 repeat protein
MDLILTGIAMKNTVCRRCRSMNRPEARFCAISGQALSSKVSGSKIGWPEVDFIHVLSRINLSSYTGPPSGRFCLIYNQTNRGTARHYTYCGSLLPTNRHGFLAAQLSLVVVAAPGGRVEIPEGLDEEGIDIGRQSHKQLKGHSKRITTVSFSPDGQMLASSSGDGTIRLWGIAP